MYTVTVDINSDSPKIRALEAKGIIKIYRIRIENNKNKQSAILPTSVLGRTVLGQMRFGSDQQTKVFNKLKKIIGINNINDCIHLEAHIRDRRDYFVTEDHDILDARTQLKEDFPELEIRTVNEIINELQT
ncbi:MAG: hypothetical protein ABSE17_02310 [Candidatus Levyibacteriota bacterium]